MSHKVFLEFSIAQPLPIKSVQYVNHFDINHINFSMVHTFLYSRSLNLNHALSVENKGLKNKSQFELIQYQGIHG